jgi:hypothetical protein
MNVKTFGTDDKLAEFGAKYGSTDYAVVGAEITRVQRESVGRVQVGSISPTQIRTRSINVASEKAVDYLVSLSSTRTPQVEETLIRIWAANVDRSEVSAKIDELKAMPVKGLAFATDPRAPKADNSLERHNVPAGRYAVDGNEGQTVFVVVDRPTEGRWAGRIFVKVQASDELHRTSRGTADALLGKIAAAGPEAACIRYGREIGVCGRCGRTLTDETSRANGIGPVCADKGW